MKRILFAALGLVSLALPAMAGPRDDVLYGISRCGGIANDRTWLDCVYGAAQPMRATLGLPPAPASQQALVPPPIPGQAAPQAQAMAAPPAMSPDQQKDFEAYSRLSVVPKFILKMATPTETKPEPATTLRSYKFDAAGYFIVTLANGETWRQSASDTVMARWNKPAPTYAVQIIPTSSQSGRALKVGPQTFQVEQVVAKGR